MGIKKAESEYQPGKNPESIKNLIHDGRPSAEKVYGEPKKKRTLSVTETGWKQASSKIKQMGYSSVSEFLERWGRDDRLPIEEANNGA